MRENTNGRLLQGKGLQIQINNKTINLFINSDAILNRDALWSIQGKKHYLQATIAGGIHHTRKILP